MTALLPTITDIENLQFFSTLVLGVVAVLFAVKWGLDHAIDWLCLREEAIPEEPSSVVVDFADRHRKVGRQ